MEKYVFNFITRTYRNESWTNSDEETKVNIFKNGKKHAYVVKGSQI